VVEAVPTLAIAAFVVISEEPADVAVFSSCGEGQFL